MNRRNNFQILYVCLTIIILTFFVFLTVNSTISPEKKKIAIGSLIGSFGIFKSGINPFGKEKMENIGFDLINIGSSKNVLEALKKILLKTNLENFIEISGKKEGLLFKVKKGIAFINGTDKIKKIFYIFLNRAYNILSQAEFKKIEILAFPDLNFNKKDFISYFDLSSHRAFKIGDFFKKRGISTNIIECYGNGDYSSKFDVIIKIKGKIMENAIQEVGSKNINIHGFRFEVK